MKPIRIALATVLAVAALCAAPRASTETPAKLSDAEFWKLSADLSEPGGQFRSDNLLSNEMGFQTILDDLTKIVKPGVYMGVGPEQNFTYIAALKPKMAIITDIRRGNLHLHLMYKALFEMATDRTDFVGMLFSKKRPETLAGSASVSEIFLHYDAVPASEAVYTDTWKRMIGHLTKSPHQLPLEKNDIDGIKYVFDSFYTYGMGINYNSTNGTGGGRGSMANYYQLMTTNDGGKPPRERSYLASDEAFKFMQDLESKNLLVPVVGDFAGPKALRAVGRYIRDHGETVQAFYLSNVEDYLPMGGTWEKFCNNVSSLPLTESSTYIFGQRPQGGGFPGSGLASYYRPMLSEVVQYKCKP